MVSPGETFEFRQKRLYSILCFPVIKVALECISWTGAISTFMQKSRGAAKRPAAEQANALPGLTQSVDLEESQQSYLHEQPENTDVEVSHLI